MQAKLLHTFCKSPPPPTHAATATTAAFGPSASPGGGAANENNQSLLSPLARGAAATAGIISSPPGMSNNNKQAVSQQQPYKSVLDPSVSRNLAISLSSTLSGGKRPTHTVVSAIAELDVVALGGGSERAALLSANSLLFDVEKVVAPLQAACGGGSQQQQQQQQPNLPPHERFALEISRLPGARLRLGILAVESSAEELSSGACSRLNLLNTVCHEIRESEGLSTLLLDVILPLGNKLNTGGVGGEGAAVGFRLSSLSKLVQTKSANGETFLGFVVDGLLEAAPHLLDVAGREGLALPSLFKASGAAISRESAAADLVRLETCLSHCSQLRKLLLTMVKSNPSQYVNTLDRLASVESTVGAHVEAVRAASSSATSAFSQLCTYLGEDSRKISPETLVGWLQGFAGALLKNAEVGREKRDRAARKAAAAAAAASRGTKTTTAAAAARRRSMVRGGGAIVSPQLLQQQQLLLKQMGGGGGAQTTSNRVASEAASPPPIPLSSTTPVPLLPLQLMEAAAKAGLMDTLRSNRAGARTSLSPSTTTTPPPPSLCSILHC